MPPTLPSARPTLTGALAGVLTAAVLFALSWYLGITPGVAATGRADLLFQSDTGQFLSEVVTGNMEIGRGVHPVLHLVWRVPLHKLAVALDPAVPPATTAAVGSRLLIAAVAGVGVGRLVTAAVRFGVRPGTVAAVGPLFLLGTAQVIACLPEHFGLSLGVLAAAFGVFLDGLRGPVGGAAVRLAVLTAVASGITVTNAALPAGLLVLLAVARRVSGWWYVAGAVAAAAGAGVVVVYLTTDPDRGSRFGDRVNLYLNWRLPDRPAEAAKYTFRGLIDPVVGPDPAVDTNNLDAVRMVTYEPRSRPYEAWPYTGTRAAAAGVWLVVLGAGAVRLARAPDGRLPLAALAGWVGGNAAFHNVWGDEYFLYSPHYSWALVAVPLLGLRGVHWAWPAAAAAVVAVGQVEALGAVRAAVESIPG